MWAKTRIIGDRLDSPSILTALKKLSIIDPTGYDMNKFRNITMAQDLTVDVLP